MCVVVLDADELGLLLERPLRRQVLGMEIVRDHLRLGAEHREVQVDIGEERSVGQLRVEIAEVRGQERLLSSGDAEGALQLRSGGDDRAGCSDRQREGAGHVATRSADRVGGSHEGVLAAAVDRPVVREESVGDPAEPLPSLAVLVSVGSSERLPLVSTSAPPISASRRWWSGV